MTASRWWVRAAARWVARINGVSEQARLAMLGLTGISTASLTLRQYGHGEYAWPLIGAVVGGTIVYAYLFTEGGVWNQVARDRKDMSMNYSTPSMRIDDELIARGVAAGFKGAELGDGEREAIQSELDDAFTEHRDGVPINGDRQEVEA